MYEIRESRVRGAAITAVMLVIAVYLSWQVYEISTREGEVAIDVRQFDLSIPPITYGDHFYGVDFVGDHGWVVGTYGTIIHTADGGRRWSRQRSSVAEPLFSVSFPTGQDGWAAGKGGVIVRTRDGGDSWTPQASGTKHLLSGIRFVDAQSGWAVGEWGTILHTADGGEHWETQRGGEDVVLNGVFLLDAARGWVVGEKGTILFTEDGGATWSPRGEGIDIEISERVRGEPLRLKDLSLYAVHFTADLEGWIVGIDGVMLHTADGGASWEVLPRMSDRSLFDVRVQGGVGWAVGNEGAFLVSADGGRTWRGPDPSPVPTTYWLYRADFLTPERGYLVGAHGTLLRTEDGGASWVRLGNGSEEQPS